MRAVCITPWSQEIKISQKAPQWDVQYTADWSQARRCVSQHRVKLYTAESKPKIFDVNELVNCDYCLLLKLNYNYLLEQKSF